MFENTKALLTSQYSAALTTLKNCIEQCPDEAWNQRVCNHVFSQAAFHALFWTDLYLGPNQDAISDQDFHRKHVELFRGYEQLHKKKPETQYTREFILTYFEHCVGKMREVIRKATEAHLQSGSGFGWIKGTVAEVHVYNIRHIQHHAAQLSLRLRLDGHAEIAWERGEWPSTP